MQRFFKHVTIGIAVCFFTMYSVNGQLSFVCTDEGVELRDNGKKILFYQQQPKALGGKYTRAGYVHPLYGLDETVLTEAEPADHLYHSGIFWAWHQIIVNDKNIADGWICENISWTPEKMKVKKSGRKIAIHTEMLWRSPLNTATPEPIVRERTKIIVHRVAAPGYRIIDFDIFLLPLAGTVKLGGSDDHKGYGGFSLRLDLPDDLRFVSDGKPVEAKETAVEAAPWMDFRGSFGGQGSPASGVALFCKAESADAVMPWILRKKTSMQNAPYPGREPVALPAKGLRLEYRLVVHDNSLSDEAIRELYKAYIR